MTDLTKVFHESFGARPYRTLYRYSPELGATFYLWARPKSGAVMSEKAAQETDPRIVEIGIITDAGAVMEIDHGPISKILQGQRADILAAFPDSQVSPADLIARLYLNLQSLSGVNLPDWDSVVIC